MPFPQNVREEITKYCTNHLPEDNWYEIEFIFIKDLKLRERIIEEFKAIRFAYKLYEGFGAKNENLLFEVRNQILAYASIYEAIIENVLETYYFDTQEYDDLMHHVIPVQISIPMAKLCLIQEALTHDGKKIIPFYYKKRKKDKPQVRFDDKCKTAESLGLIHSYKRNNGEIVDLPGDIIEIYSYRNGIHLIAEQRKGISYELELSKKAYRRMRPFIDQIKEQLVKDGKINSDLSRQ